MIMKSVQDLYKSLLAPSADLIQDIPKIEGDIMLLGAGGKMGPALARLIKSAITAAGVDKKVLAVSRFSEDGLKQELEAEGIKTFAADLLDDRQLNKLPETPNIIYLAGQKFGTTGRESFTWAMNAYLPGRVGERFKNSRIVAFSTGNVYPLSPVMMGGLDESHRPGPVGEYAQSCLGRERLFEYTSSKYNTPVLIYRLNYASDVSYGVMLEVAKSVLAEKPVDLRMGHVNLIWQGDANEMAIRSLLHCSSPPKLLNVTGPEIVSIQWLANQFALHFAKTAHFENEAQSTALLSNSAEAFKLFGYPKVSLKLMIEMVAAWLLEGGKTINKPTHFQERNGQF
jgi:hypothetical protein